MSLDSKYQLFRILPDSLQNRIERSVYNRRKRGLFFIRENIRKRIAKLISSSDYYIVDSMPLKVHKLSRSICKEDYLSTPDKGFCATQKMHYYGYKLHAACTIDGVFTGCELTKASVHDIHYLKNIRNDYANCCLLAYRGYLSRGYQLDLFEANNIRVEVPMRMNQHHYKSQAFLFRKSKKRIVILFSQLCDQFMIRRNYAKSFE